MIASIEMITEFTGIASVTPGPDLSSRGRKAVAIPEALGDCSGTGILPVILMDRRDAYPTKTLAMTFLGRP